MNHYEIEALPFEKRSKNFCKPAARQSATAAQKFLGLFFKKRTLPNAPAAPAE
jgi:hypothetical protein